MKCECVPAETTPTRARLLRRGILLERFIVVYNVLEGVVAVGAGWRAGSIALVGFGVDSAIETVSALVVLFRLREELRGHDPDSHVMTERRAERFVGATLFALSVYICYEATTTLVHQDAPSESPLGIGLAGLSLLLMPVVGLAKRRTGRALGSRALIADSTETFICALLSFSLLLGLVLNAVFGWWWADPIAALVMVPFILREARKAWAGDDTDLDPESNSHSLA